MDKEIKRAERTEHAIKKILELKVSDIMRREVITLDAEDLLATAARTMVENKINGIVIMKDSVPWTVLNSWDLLHQSYLESFSDKMDYLRTPLSEFIDRPQLHSLPPSATLMEAARLVAEKHVKTIPVIENGKLQGVVSTYDLINSYNNIIILEKLGMDI